MSYPFSTKSTRTLHSTFCEEDLGCLGSCRMPIEGIGSFLEVPRKKPMKSRGAGGVSGFPKKLGGVFKGAGFHDEKVIFVG